MLVKRKAYYRTGGRRVRGTSFNIKDRGAPGKGPQVIPPLKKGSLGFTLKGKSQKQINKLALAHARKVGERRAGGQLRALATLNKRTNKPLSKKASTASSYVFKNIGSYKGKK